MAHTAEILHVLAVDPTGQEMAWYDTKSKAVSLFGSEEGRQLLEMLKEKGVEAAFLLDAEAEMVSGGGTAQSRAARALETLREVVGGHRVLEYPNAAYRAAALLLQLGSSDHGERHRLLRAAEAGRVRFGAEEEFDLACLAYIVGDFRDGAQRFTRLRDSGRASRVAGEKQYLVERGSHQPLELRGRVDSFEGGRGWMWIFQEGERLFRAPFQGQHFGHDRRPPGRSAWEDVFVRFTGFGPRAIPRRFYFAGARRGIGGAA